MANCDTYAQKATKYGQAQLKRRKEWAFYCEIVSYLLLVFGVCVAPYMFHMMLKLKSNHESDGFCVITTSNAKLVLLPAFTMENASEMDIWQIAIVCLFTGQIWYNTRARFDKNNHSFERLAAQFLMFMQVYLLWVMAYNMMEEKYDLYYEFIALGFIVLLMRTYMYSCCPEGFDPAFAPPIET